MNVALIHFHLRKGGVTSVILQQASALLAWPNPPRVAILSGTPSAIPTTIPIEVIPGLDYDAFGPAAASSTGALPEVAQKLADSMERALDKAFPSGCDLLHVHNPLLSKNRHLLGALAILHRKGIPLLLQVHDFAEDFRPEVLETYWPYPEGCHYAVINTRDRDHLVAAGLEPRQVHLLTNPVEDPGEWDPRGNLQEEKQRGRSTILYPVRGIRRKNLGEALLLSRFLSGSEVAVTLPPTSPGDQQRYARWKAFARESDWPIRFEAGVAATLSQLYQATARVLTTSVKEAFGYSYIDPLVRGVPVLGRELPAAVNDFRTQGIPLPGLYRSLQVPREWVSPTDLDALQSSIIDRLTRAFSPLFADPYRWAALSTALATRFKGEHLDFGSLNEPLQERVLTVVNQSDGAKARLLVLNPFLVGWGERVPTPDDLDAQRRQILQAFSSTTSARQLQKAYEATLSVQATGSIDRAALASRFLVPQGLFGVAT